MAETRNVTQYRIFVLQLNPMAGKCEETRIVAISDDYDRLVNWYDSLKVPVYEDHFKGMYPVTYRKQFQRGSDLEWFNPANSVELNNVDHYGHGIIDMWVNEESYNDHILNKKGYTVV